MNKKVIKNCKIYDDTGELDNYDLLIDDGMISALCRSGENEYLDYETIEGANNILIPGLIDVHIQGAGGSDILDANDDAIMNISKTLAVTGTTSYLATSVVKPEEGNEHLKLAKKYYCQKTDGAELIGIHLEGPFINIKKKGGLNPSGVYDSTKHGGLTSIMEVTGESLRMMTIAPELNDNDIIIKQLRENGIIASFAHSDADYNETKMGWQYGINHVTHLFNAMRPIAHREPGPIPAIFENKNISAQIISDGHHIHPAMVNMAYKNLGIERCILITDGMHGIGLPDGTYMYNGREYISKDGAARYLDGTLIGSTMSLLNITLNFMKFTGCTFFEALQTVTYNPAKLLGIENKKGVIKIGADADLLLLNHEYGLQKTIINGNVVYSK